MIKLSATRINAYLSCKAKYWFQYVDHLPKISNPAFKLGLACHESLELAGNIWMEKGKFDDADYEKIYKFYNEISIREGIEEMAVHKEGKELVKSRLSSFSLGTKILSLEETFGFKTGNNMELATPLGVPIIGAMDKVVELDDESIIVVDYKTSKTAPTPEQLKEDLQLSLYDLVASILWPKYKRIILCLDMLRSEPIYTYRTLEQRKELDKYLLSVYNAMKGLKKKDAKPSLNIFCPWCDFKDYCEAYKEVSTKTEYEFLPTSKLSNKELVSEYETVANTAKILDNRKRELGMVIMEKIKNSGENLMGEEKQVYIRQNARTTYNPYTVQSLVPKEEFAGMVSLNKKAVDSYCSRNPQIKNKIIKGSTTNHTNPFLATKKIPKPKKSNKKSK